MMKQFRLTVEKVGSKWVTTLLDNGETDTDPHTIATQGGDTIPETIDRIRGYIEREVLASEHKEDSL